MNGTVRLLGIGGILFGACLTGGLGSLPWTKLVPDFRPVEQFLLASTDKIHRLAAQFVAGEEETVSACD